MEIPVAYQFHLPNMGQHASRIADPFPSLLYLPTIFTMLLQTSCEEVYGFLAAGREFHSLRAYIYLQHGCI
jgi:hypothetical protein